ncbi:MAG: DUF1674 domain-containing protein [Proteobacteria bacterium]|nr:DUF1674 domain-containing protein [Pseudomonadota bacterium]
MTHTKPNTKAKAKPKTAKTKPPRPPVNTAQNKTGEIGGPKGLEPTRYGDWEKNGRCSDF